MRIYVAGPFSDRSEQAVLKNVMIAVDAGWELLRRGHDALVPHLNYWLDQRAKLLGTDLGYETYLRNDLAWLRVAEGMLCLGSSPGTDRELALAKELGIPIYYNIEEVPRANAEGQTVQDG